MQKKLVFITYILLLILNLDIRAIDFKETLKTLGHWGISAGPSWMEAKSYFDLLSDKNTLNFVGDKDFDEEESNKIRSYLNEKICLNWKKIPIKIIKEEMRVYISNALVCTDSIIFVNPDIYDLIDQEEKNQNILEVGTLISQRYTLTSGLFLSFLPFGTTLACKAYSKIIEKIYENIPQNLKHNKIETLIKANSYIINSCLVKLVINKLLTKSYFKFQEERNKKIVEKRLNSK